LGAPARKLQQRQPQDLLHFCEGDVEFIEDDEGPVPGDQSGLRTFQVEIVNKSVPDRVLSNVHVYCAGFDGVGLVVLPPSDFRRISEGECLVNDGGQLTPACLFIARVTAWRFVAEVNRGRPPLPLFIFYLEQGRGRGSQRARGGGRGPGRGGRWGERPPARSPAAGVVEGGGGA